MRYRVGEIVWYWPAGWMDSMPPLAAVITAEKQTAEYGLTALSPPGVYPETHRVWAHDADETTTVNKLHDRFRARTGTLDYTPGGTVDTG